MTTLRNAVSILVLCALVAPAGAAQVNTQAQKCERTVDRGLASCINAVGPRVLECYLATGSACVPTEPAVVKALAKLATRIQGACPDAATIQTVGYGTFSGPADVVARAQEACRGEPATLVARTFGGPQAAVLTTADAPTKQCLATASGQALKLLKREATLRGACINRAHHGRSCNLNKLDAKIATAETRARQAIDPGCPGLKSTIGLDTAAYVGRAAEQARCITATAHGDLGNLAPDCGSRAGVSAPRGTWTQVVLPESVYGTRCGDGSSYAFWVRLPPAGSPSERVAVDLQGGGVCIFESDCAAVPADLFSATDDVPPTSGMFSTNPSENPFSDWTMVFLPYCTQDVHIGGGITDVFPSITVNRFGAINVRAALRYVRDVVWGDLAATEAQGYRPDRLTVVFGGESAGGFGVNYNYHYLLDDLRWAHTTAVPDSGLALDNGQLIGVQGLGVIVQGETGSLAWGVKPYQPSYCQATTCAIGPVLQAATSPRLKAVPEQQIINVSNQIDDTQVSTTFFATTQDWINAARTAYCANRGLPGIRNWLPARTAPYHTILTVASRWSSVTAGGETLPDFLAGAIADSDGVTDHVDEGTLVADYPGVNPLGCPGSPSGAFLD
jgi:hypothetical protein